MGIGLVKAAYDVAAARGLREHAPMRVFVYMAVSALDSDARPAYFGGRYRLAHALGAPPTSSGLKLVKQAVSALNQRGLIQLDVRPAPGREARYALLDGAGAPLRINAAPPESSDTKTGDHEGAVNSSERGTLSDPTGHPQGAQRGTLTRPLRRDGGTKEEESTPPPRTCTIHPDWDHDRPCRRCGHDRQARRSLAQPSRTGTRTPPLLRRSIRLLRLRHSRGRSQTRNRGSSMTTETVQPEKSSSTRSTRGRGRRSEALQRKAEALALRAAGLTYRSIGQRLGMTESGARKTVLSGLNELRREKAEQVLELELARLDRLQLAVWQRAICGDRAATLTVLKIMDRRAKYLSLDNPELTDAVAGASTLLSALAGQLGAMPDTYEPVRDDLTAEHAHYPAPPGGSEVSRPSSRPAVWREGSARRPTAASPTASNQRFVTSRFPR